jgi:hypothetical protein
MLLPPIGLDRRRHTAQSVPGTDAASDVAAVRALPKRVREETGWQPETEAGGSTARTA